MPTSHNSSSVSPPLGRPHKEYFIAEADTTFKVENTLFKVHKYFFVRESPYFEKLFRHPAPPCNDPPGLSETNPVVLKDITSEAFAGLLGVFYNRKYSIYNCTVDQWTRILALAQRWEFKEVEGLCVRELEKMPIPAVEKIDIYQAFRLDRGLLAESFAKLTLRDESLTIDEGRKLGVDTAIQITQARELTRRLNSGMGPTGAHSHDFSLIIRDVFELKEEDLDLVTGPASGPPPQQQQQQQHQTATSDNRKKDRK
ncbi:hypothetical protein BC827DRAFT_854080 [Russula dissimulans]|nr:hypothetical protein BC827DRAFT_854080 [Russula dissimulans]